MNGEIDFKESLRQRVALLSGAPVTILDHVRNELKFTEGAHFLCKALKKLGYKLGITHSFFFSFDSCDFRRFSPSCKLCQKRTRAGLRVCKPT